MADLSDRQKYRRALTSWMVASGLGALSFGAGYRAAADSGNVPLATLDMLGLVACVVSLVLAVLSALEELGR